MSLTSYAYAHSSTNVSDWQPQRPWWQSATQSWRGGGGGVGRRGSNGDHLRTQITEDDTLLWREEFDSSQRDNIRNFSTASERRKMSSLGVEPGFVIVLPLITPGQYPSAGELILAAISTWCCSWTAANSCIAAQSEKASTRSVLKPCPPTKRSTVKGELAGVCRRRENVFKLFHFDWLPTKHKNPRRGYVSYCYEVLCSRTQNNNVIFLNWETKDCWEALLTGSTLKRLVIVAVLEICINSMPVPYDRTFCNCSRLGTGFCKTRRSSLDKFIDSGLAMAKAYLSTQQKLILRRCFNFVLGSRISLSKQASLLWYAFHAIERVRSSLIDSYRSGR